MTHLRARSDGDVRRDWMVFLNEVIGGEAGFLVDY